SIARVLKSFPDVHLIDYSGDCDHNRSVFTFLGKTEDVLEAVLSVSGKALELIDMRSQAGVHPRLGAVDVVPFIPLGKTKMADAVDLARRFGQKLYERFNVPVYYYGEAALVSARRELAHVRHGGYEALKDKMKDPESLPDVGNAEFNPR